MRTLADALISAGLALITASILACIAGVVLR